MKMISIPIIVSASIACSSHATTSTSAKDTDPRSSSDRRAPGRSFVASAPPGLSLNDLGRPFTADFQRYQGAQGQSLFPRAGPALRTPQHIYKQETSVIDSREELVANAGAWGIRIGANESSNSRFASYRALEIDDVHEIDDTSKMERPPRGAVYYPWRVYMGRSYEVVLEGSAEQFNANMRADFLVFSGDIGAFSRRNKLEQSVSARGLAPRNDRAIFARSTEQIEKLYRSTVDDPVPILVEWRRIPGAAVDHEPIEWKQLRGGCRGEPGCEPCKRWSFTRIEVGIPRRKRDGRVWDADESAPDVVLNLRAGGDDRTSTKTQAYKRTWTLSPPVAVEANARLRLRAIDKDLVADDPIFTLNASPGETLAGGRLEFGSGSAIAFGDCVEQTDGAAPRTRARRKRSSR